MTHEPHQLAGKDATALDVLVVSACFPPAWSWGGQPRSVWMALSFFHSEALTRLLYTSAFGHWLHRIYWGIVGRPAPS